MFPKQKQIKQPLLEVLIELGGEAEPYDVYYRVSKRFPKLTSEDLSCVTESGSNKWRLNVRWARKKLIADGLLVNRNDGIWAVSTKGYAYGKDQTQLGGF